MDCGTVADGQREHGDVLSAGGERMKMKYYQLLGLTPFGAWFIPGGQTNSMNAEWHQVVTLGTDGTMKITKFDRWVQRTINDVITTH